MQHIILSKETIGRIEYDAKAYCYDKNVHGEGIGYYFAGAMAEATKNIRVANVLEAIINAIPNETEDQDWWPDGLRNAINEGNAALLEQAQPIPEETPDRMPAQFIPVSIAPENGNVHYCIIKYKVKNGIARFYRGLIEFSRGEWLCNKGWEVTDWLCEDAEFIDRINQGKI